MYYNIIATKQNILVEWNVCSYVQSNILLNTDSEIAGHRAPRIVLIIYIRVNNK